MSANTQCVDPDRTAASGARSVTERIQPAAALLQRLWNRMILARRRRAAINELSRLADRELADIGIRREQIPEAVAGAQRRGMDSRRASGSQRP